MSQKIVVKVSIICNRCKTCILKAVTKLDGIDSITLDAENNTLIVVGDVDPVRIITHLRKAGKGASIVSVGSNDPPPEPPKNDGGGDGGGEEQTCTNRCQPVCAPTGYPYVVYEEPNGCTIV